MNYLELIDPKYKPGQKVLVDGVECMVKYPVFYQSHNSITGETKYIGVRYRLENYPQDVDEEKIFITPEQLIP